MLRSCILVTLQGKYLDPGGGPQAARLNKYKGRYLEAESRYGPKPNMRPAVEEYVQLADKAGMLPAELAIRQAIPLSTLSDKTESSCIHTLDVDMAIRPHFDITCRPVVRVT